MMENRKIKKFKTIMENSHDCTIGYHGYLYTSLINTLIIQFVKKSNRHRLISCCFLQYLHHHNTVIQHFPAGIPIIFTKLPCKLP